MKPLITYLEVLPVQLSSTTYVCSSTTSYTCTQTSHFFSNATYNLKHIFWQYLSDRTKITVDDARGSTVTCLRVLSALTLVRLLSDIWELERQHFSFQGKCLWRLLVLTSPALFTLLILWTFHPHIPYISCPKYRTTCSIAYITTLSDACKSGEMDTGVLFHSF